MLVKNQQNKLVLRRLGGYVKPYLWLIITGIICLGAGIAFDITFSTLQEPYVKTVEKGISLYQENGSSEIALSGVQKLIRKFTILFSLLLIGTALINIIWPVIMRLINKDLAIEYVDSVLLTPFSQSERYYSGDFVNRLTQDSNNAITTMGQLMMLIPVQIITGGIALVLLIKMNWLIAVLALIAGFLSIYLPRVFDKKIYGVNDQLNMARSKLRSFLQETLQGIQVIKGSSLETWTIMRFTKQREKVASEELRVNLLQNYAAVLFSIIYNSLTLTVYWLIVSMSVQGQISAGSLMVAMLLINRVWRPIEGISGSFSELQQVGASLQRVFEIVDLPQEKPAPISWEKVNEPILAMEEVTFAFPDNPHNLLFNKFNLIIKHGETVGVVGPSGAGKTTLARLCLGLYEPIEGQIKVLGNSFRENPLEIRRRLAYVPQEPYIFTGTIKDNVSLGELSYSEEEIINALKQANAEDFISQLPEGINTLISEAGKDLSGGQRQRIALARAFLRPAELVVLDEPTSALDNENQALITEAIARLSEHSATIIIAHRLATVKNADRIIVLNKGQIVEAGDHEELLALKGLYAELYLNQSEVSVS
jgi:ATP-binding cassette subfamily B protein/subfamily B ATP-binding cassette protein MsbA